MGPCGLLRASPWRVPRPLPSFAHLPTSAILLVKSFLRQQLERYVQRLEELDFLLSREDIMADMSQYRVLTREHAKVTQVAGR